MSLPPLPTTTLAIIINWVQRMGQIPRRYWKLFGEVGAKQARVGNGQKKMPSALILPLYPPCKKPPKQTRVQSEPSSVTTSRKN